MCAEDHDATGEETCSECGKDIRDRPQCCNLAEAHIIWRRTNHADGPEEDGWSIIVGRTGDCFENVKFCPFCGYDLYKDEKELEEGLRNA